MSKKTVQTQNYTTDIKLEPFYKSNIKVNGLDVLLFDLDNHCNKVLLAKNSYLTEYYTSKNECIIIPEYIATRLHLTDDNILDAYYKTQESARKKIMQQSANFRIFTFLFVLVMVLVTFDILLVPSYFFIVPYFTILLIINFPLKNYTLKNSFKNFIHVICKKYDNAEVSQNFDEIMAYLKTIDYMSDKQKITNIKHFANLKEMVNKNNA